MRPELVVVVGMLACACTAPNPGFLGQGQDVDGSGAAPGPALPDGSAGVYVSPGGLDAGDDSASPCASAAVGAPCRSPDPCVVEAACDGLGECKARRLMDCGAPHAFGAACIDGACTGHQCEVGWGNCNEDWSDGCEASLTDDKDSCGGCDHACPAPPHAVATCVGGACGHACVTPYQDCNGLVADGCEIPVGVANSCDRQGLTSFSAAAKATPGCGTPACGAGGGQDASFGSWHCSFCEHCQLFADGGSWCMVDTGRFSSDRCDWCCNPTSPSFPQVCAP